LVVSHLKVPTLGRQHQKCTPVVRKWGEGTDLTGKVSLTLPVRSVDPHLRLLSRDKARLALSLQKNKENKNGFLIENLRVPKSVISSQQIIQ
jgi:hypothetical protein